MTSTVLFIALFVWILSYLRLPYISFPQVNVVQRCNFATLNAIGVLMVYLIFLLSQ
jgi:hypothetical protein